MPDEFDYLRSVDEPDPGTIKPALTPGEWDTPSYGDGGRLHVHRVTRHGNVALLIGDKQSSVELRRLHALAAVALYGQPFGFTHAMASALSHFVRLYTDPNYLSEPNPEVVEQARRGIAVIRALLPPNAELDGR